MNSRELGNGVGQPTRAKERAWDTLPGNTKRGEGRGEEPINLPRDSQGEPRLLAPSHSQSFHKASQVSEPAARRRRPSLSLSQSGRGKLRTEPASQKGSDLGDCIFVGF